jgi:hypothetical protein
MHVTSASRRTKLERFHVLRVPVAKKRKKSAKKKAYYAGRKERRAKK